MTIEELEIIIRANITDAMSGIKKITDEVKSAISKSVEPMKNLTTQAKEMASKSASSVAQMKAQMKSYSSSIQETSKQQEYLKSKIEDLKNLLAMADKGFEVGDTMKIESDIEKLENRLKRLQNQGKSTGTETSSAFDKIKAKVKDAGTQLSGLGGKFKTVLFGSKGLGKNLTSTFNNGIKSIKKFAMGLLSVRTAFSVVSKAMQSYLSYDTQLSNSVQNCWNVLGSLLAPVLEYVVSLFSKAVSYVNAFVQALTGINLVARANKKAIDSQAKSTKNLADTQSSLDEFHTVSADTGTGGGTENKPITVENVSVEGLLDKILNYDWNFVGIELGSKINAALSSINWDFIQKLASALAFDLASLLNGLLIGTDWNLVGTTIGKGINTVLLVAYTFVTTFDWAQFGTAIADAIMGIFNTVDWKMAGETLSAGIRGIFSSIKALLAGIDWQQVGNDIWTFIASIDWTGMISDLAFILGQAIAGIGQFIWGFIEDAVKSIGDYFSQKISECGGNIIAGLFKGIIDAFVGIGVWLYENVCIPFIDGFKSMFGIHSPSTIMADLGVFLVEGLKNGLSGIWDKIKEIFTNLKNNIVNAFNNIKNGISNVMTTIKNTMSSIWNKIWSIIKNVVNWIICGVESMCNTVIRGLNKIIKPLTEIGNAILKAIGIDSFSFSVIPEVSLPRLAKGGVLTEDTIVRVAEYSNAKSNPEIVSPRDMMKETMKEAILESGMNNPNQKLEVEVVGETRINGDDIVITYDKAKNNKGYNGGKNPSFAY